MRILMITPYAMIDDLSKSFIFNQARAMVQCGAEVEICVITAFGKSINSIGRFKEYSILVEGVNIHYIRHLSFGKWGSKSINVETARAACLRHYESKEFGFDVIIGHTIQFGGTTANSLGESKKVPFVIVTHGGDTEDAVKTENAESTRKLCKNCLFVSAVSRKLEKKLNSIGVDNTICIYNGFRIENIPANLYDKQFEIVQTGHLIESKHFEQTILAFSELLHNGMAPKLVLIGDGNKASELKSMCEKLKIQDKVSFRGQISNEEVQKCNSVAKYFVMPSYPEGFGIVYLEAMAARCIVIGVEGEGIAEVIENGSNGFLIHRDDWREIVNIVQYCESHNDEQTRIADEGRKTAMSFTWKVNAENYLAKLREMVGVENE